MQALDFKDVMILPQLTDIGSRKEVNLEREFHFKYSPFVWKGVPIASSNMNTVTTLEAAEVLLANKMLPVAHKSFEWLGTAWSVGLDYDFKKSILTPIICADVANGGMTKFLHFVEKLRTKYPEKVIIAGNTVTDKITRALIEAGADVVKIGIGSGYVCRTREVTGVGMPQITAILECATEADILGAHVMSDGGCRTAGDVCKAFAAGADFVMLGSLLAGHVENGSQHYGLSSKTANDKFSGGMQQYKAAEGVHITMPHRGSLQTTLDTIMGGLRSCCAYVGARDIGSLSSHAEFIQVVP